METLMPSNADLSMMWHAIHTAKGEITPPSPKDNSRHALTFTLRMNELIAGGYLIAYGGAYYVTDHGKVEVWKYRAPPKPTAAGVEISKKANHHIISGIAFRAFKRQPHLPAELHSVDERAIIRQEGSIFNLKIDGRWVKAPHANPAHKQRKPYVTQIAAAADAVTLIKSTKPPKGTPNE